MQNRLAVIELRADGQVVTSAWLIYYALHSIVFIPASEKTDLKTGQEIPHI